jgi:predicted ribosomally synthesized peptide with SipW-like signal peptide
MSNDFELSRRKALAALGSIGVASAGAGLGTSAYFSDQETFQNNRLVAGELDLKMDWEEHYSDWSADENDDRSENDGGESADDDGQGEFEVTMEQPENPAMYTAFPPGTAGFDNGQDPLLWVPNAYVDDFMDNTSIEAYPDADNDGIAEFPIEEMNGRAPCDYLADVGDDDGGLDPDSDPLGRTDNDDTRLNDGSPAPMINLQDVKPGDFGEVTFSTHLCDNPGYLWMNMPGGLTASENGFTEPELDDPDEDGPGGEVELVDQLQTALWYDDCDNLYTCDEQIDLMIVADTSQSIGGDLDDDNEDNTTPEQAEILRDSGNDFISALDAMTEGDELRAGFLTFNGPGDSDDAAPPGSGIFDRPALRAGLGPLSQFDDTGDGNPDLGKFLPSQGNGNTPLPYALDLANQVLQTQGRPGAKKVIFVITDGLPDYVGSGPTVPYTVEENEGGPLALTGNTYTSATYSDGNSDGTSSQDEQDESAAVATTLQNDGVTIRVAGIGLSTDANNFLAAGIAGTDGDPDNEENGFFYDPDDFPSLSDLAETIATDIAGGLNGCEEIIFSGTLGELETELTANDGRGIPLEGDLPAEDGGGSGRNCFAASATHCFGFSWWLPVDHANELQGDGVSFDLGFYTEQCRHNDGSGMNNENVDPQETDA